MKYSILLSLAVTFTFLSCASTLTNDDTDIRPYEVFDEFWEFVDTRYIYFGHKGVNWDKVGDKYRSLIDPNMSEDDLFDLCNDAMLELKDTHCRMESAIKRSRNYNYTEGYEIHYSWEVIKNNYLNDTIQQNGNIKYSIINNEVGYMTINKMSGYRSLPRIAKEMKEQGVKGLIIDIRHNGGGDSNPIPDMISYFIDKPTSIGYFVEKSGPGHNDVTAPIEMITQPSTDFNFGLPITLITNRVSYSASSYMAAMFKAVEGITVVGQITGGGGGGNYSYQLSTGWVVAVSISDFLDTELNSIEAGVMPDVLIENSLQDIEAGRDMMLEKAMEIIIEGQR